MAIVRDGVTDLYTLSPLSCHICLVDQQADNTSARNLVTAVLVEGFLDVLLSRLQCRRQSACDRRSLVSPACCIYKSSRKQWCTT